MILPTSQAGYAQTRWSLTDLFPGPNSPELEAAFTRLDRLTQDLAGRREELRDDIPAAEFYGIVRQLEEITHLSRRLSSFAGLGFAADTQDPTALALLARVEQFGAELSNRLLFFDLWWKNVPDETAERLLAEAGDYRYWLEQMRKFKPFTLSEAEEQIINLKNVTGSGAMNTLYDAITNRYVFRLEVDGEMRELTRGELMIHVRSSDPDLRARAYQELYRVYSEDGSLLSLIYQNIVRDWHNEQVRLRGYASPIAARNQVNDLPDEVIETLLAVAQANAPLFQRYFRLKARWLGVDQLRRYDIYAPVAASSGRRYPYDEGARTVLDAFRQFDPRLEALARRVFEQQRIDSEVRRGKQGGAFCWPAVPDLTPWVKLNYQGRSDDVATMAHELGHAVHSLLAEEHSVFTFHSNLPLAETASTFGEILLLDKLLAEESDESVRRDLLFKQVDDAYATIQRQAYFALFEIQAHQLVQGSATPEQLSQAYLENLRGQFGGAVDVSEEFRWEWASIPHIYHYPFYVYAYAFGQLLVFSLYRQYQQEGETFKPRYFRLLSAGGSEEPMKLLEEAGFDPRDPAFWQGGYDTIAERLDALEKLPVER